MQLIDGKLTAQAVKQEIAEEVKKLRAAGRKQPHLAAVLVGNDGGSETYVAAKIKACEEVGFASSLVRFDASVSEQELLAAVERLNKDADVDGFIVQLPLPKHISEEKVTEAIDPAKDVDGFHPQNLGRMITGGDAFVSATPQGIMELLKRYKIETSGKHVVVIGRSNIVGRPMSILLSLKGYPGDATVTVCHSRTANLKELCLQADIIVAALGIPEFLKADMVKEGAVVIDVGTTRVAAPDTKRGWRLKGDVEFSTVAPKCSYITPVPGGVGPMTIVSLLLNTLKAASK
ncbi:bifunctional 5,10-methylenetetrahydrofolate dehydrogenase/5,10-methenyltetrahydrofolate cyclohydrolase [Geofilum rhodophaeum]|uniref:bifunctional 5,10-methylenetetrahydrofolate dehydrogenase/5,10-methenyltetrahydrofolate cyclohydrolase n=1 Tax=Geofilum rhodophaeum TaxID=1965019 RepID=UPI000B5229A1|nr:tetrahydrofolate dehydrogenase/cyclohydrolase catalytic domain-containing protein [Geofilum rhodophaeum]